MPNNVTKKEYILKGQRKKEENRGRGEKWQDKGPQVRKSLSSYPKHFDPTGWACNSRLAS